MLFLPLHAFATVRPLLCRTRHSPSSLSLFHGGVCGREKATLLYSTHHLLRRLADTPCSQTVHRTSGPSYTRHGTAHRARCFISQRFQPRTRRSTLSAGRGTFQGTVLHSSPVQCSPDRRYYLFLEKHPPDSCLNPPLDRPGIPVPIAKQNEYALIPLHDNSYLL